MRNASISRAMRVVSRPRFHCSSCSEHSRPVISLDSGRLETRATIPSQHQAETGKDGPRRRTATLFSRFPKYPSTASRRSRSTGIAANGRRGERGLRGDSATHVGDEQEEVVPRGYACSAATAPSSWKPKRTRQGRLVIDTSEFGHVQVRRTPVDELEPGMYLLLRTAGGGDYIAPLADRLMGQRAAEALPATRALEGTAEGHCGSSVRKSPSP